VTRWLYCSATSFGHGLAQQINHQINNQIDPLNRVERLLPIRRVVEFARPAVLALAGPHVEDTFTLPLHVKKVTNTE
jgi:hypothetical protein